MPNLAGYKPRPVKRDRVPEAHLCPTYPLWGTPSTTFDVGTRVAECEKARWTGGLR
jgi:hypothetical protein